MTRIQISPGMYIKDNMLYVDIVEFLQFAGVPDTDRNRDIAAQVILEESKTLYPGVPRYLVLDNENGPILIED